MPLSPRPGAVRLEGGAISATSDEQQRELAAILRDALDEIQRAMSVVSDGFDQLGIETVDSKPDLRLVENPRGGDDA